MPLSDVQKALLRDHINVSGDLSIYPNSNDGNIEVKNLLNLQNSPDFYAYKSRVTMDEWRQSILAGGGATQLDALAASKRECLLYAVRGDLNPSISAIRTALEDYCGAQNTLKAALVSAYTRKTTRGERVLSTGTGSLAVPATMTFEGSLTADDVEQARNHQG